MNYTIFLIYCIGRDLYGYWDKMEYDLAYENATKVYNLFKKVDTGKGNLYTEVEVFLRREFPIDIQM